MALTPGAEQAIRNAAPNRGRLGSDLADAIITALRHANNAGDVLTPHVIHKATITATAANHIAYGAACKLYGAFITTPATGCVLASHVRFYDGSGAAAIAAVGAITVQPGQCAGVMFLSGTDGIGLTISTDLRVFAAKLTDGTTTPDGTDNPSVTLIVGY